MLVAGILPGRLNALLEQMKVGGLRQLRSRNHVIEHPGLKTEPPEILHSVDGNDLFQVLAPVLLGRLFGWVIKPKCPFVLQRMLYVKVERVFQDGDLSHCFFPTKKIEKTRMVAYGVTGG